MTKEIKLEDCVVIYCAIKSAFFLVPQFVQTASFIAKDYRSLLFKTFRVEFFPIPGIQPRGEPEGGSWDVPKPILRMGVPRVHWPQKTSQLFQYTLCVQLRHCTSNGTTIPTARGAAWAYDRVAQTRLGTRLGTNSVKMHLVGRAGKDKRGSQTSVTWCMVISWNVEDTLCDDSETTLG